MPYLFADTGVAAERLRVLAAVFAPATRAFLLDAAPARPHLAIDLGCGPGYTTRLIAETLRPERTVGLDASASYVALARESEAPGIAFEQHDVTTVPFPMGPGDLLFCRFLLTHLAEPGTAIARWATQLRPGGLLLMEEVESIDTTNALFSRYLEIVAAMLAQQENRLYIGATLERLAAAAPVTQRLSRVWRLPVATRDAARMFALNVRVWKGEPFIRAHYASEEIAALEEGLRALTEADPTLVEAEWRLRQLAVTSA